MKNETFSIIIDESTDVSSQKHLVVPLRHEDSSSFKVSDDFLALLQVQDIIMLTVIILILCFWLFQLKLQARVPKSRGL